VSLLQRPQRHDSYTSALDSLTMGKEKLDGVSECF
jgi:hypothetical protein